MNVKGKKTTSKIFLVLIIRRSMIDSVVQWHGSRGLISLLRRSMLLQ